METVWKPESPDARVQVYTAAVEGQGQGAGGDSLPQVVGVLVHQLDIQKFLRRHRVKDGKLKQVNRLSMSAITGVHQVLHHDLPQGDSGHVCIVGRIARVL